MKRCLAILILVFFTSCKKTSNSEQYNFKTSVIVMNEHNEPYIAILQDERNKKNISITGEQIKKIDLILRTRIKEINPELEKQFNDPYNRKWNEKNNLTPKDYTIDLNKYKRQYILNEDENNNLIVLVNCFCTTHGTNNWLTKEVSVDGGGKCYFVLKINLKNGVSSKIEVNSPI